MLVIHFLHCTEFHLAETKGLSSRKLLCYPFLPLHGATLTQPFLDSMKELSLKPQLRWFSLLQCSVHIKFDWLLNPNVPEKVPRKCPLNLLSSCRCLPSPFLKGYRLEKGHTLPIWFPFIKKKKKKKKKIVVALFWGLSHNIHSYHHFLSLIP